MIHHHWHRIRRHNSQPLVQHKWVSCVNGCEWWCVMLSQWLWIMVSYIEPVTVNHGLLCYASGCESWWAMLSTVRFSIAHMIHNHWVSITHHDSQPLAQHYTPWLTATRISIAQHDSPSVCIAEQVIVNYGEFTVSMVVNDGVLCWVSGCELWCVMLSQWLIIMVCYTEPVVVNYGVLCWASGCESWCVILVYKGQLGSSK
jgi:hypothetical protein